jgi:hypothetical protein
MQNGIPWWYFQRHGGKHPLTRELAPHIAAVYACVKLLTHTMSLEKAAVRVAPLASAAES